MDGSGQAVPRQSTRGRWQTAVVDAAERAQLSAEVFESVARLVHRTAQDASSALRRDGLNPAQWQLLRTLAEHPGVTQAWLAEHRGGTPGGVSMLVTKVEAQGLVRREARGAANVLWLTERGQEVVDRLVPDQERFFTRRFEALSDAELRTWQGLTAQALEGLPTET